MAQQPDEARWYWGGAEDKRGPLTLSQLQELARAGQVTHLTPVWNEALLDWLPAGQVRVLYDAAGIAVGRPVDRSLGLVIPVGPQSALSIGAGYGALISIAVPVLGVVAVALGFAGLRDLKRHPEKRGRGRALTGIILGGVTTAYWLVFFLTVAWHR